MLTRSNNCSKQGSAPSSASRGLRPRGHLRLWTRHVCMALLGRLCVRRPHGGSLKLPRGRPPRGGWPTPRHGALPTTLPGEPGLPHPPAGRPGAPVRVQSRCSPAQRRSFPACAGFTPRNGVSCPGAPGLAGSPPQQAETLFSSVKTQFPPVLL